MPPGSPGGITGTGASPRGTLSHGTRRSGTRRSGTPLRSARKGWEDKGVAQHSFASRAYRDDAVVLRTHKLGEADRIITLLTKHHGQVRAVAKGVRRTSSRFGARLEPFMVADLQL